MKQLNQNEVLKKMSELNFRRNYILMYSSLFDGFVSDPALMLIPIDDHLVHRGDGVFEAIRFNAKKIFLLDEHLQRLQKSADFIGLKLPRSISEIAQICTDMTEQIIFDIKKQTKVVEGILRLYVSRGPGDFSPNPYSTLGSQLYIVATEFKPLPADNYIKGVSLGLSHVPVKPGFYAQAKTCNYLPNVMMKKESIDAGYDFVVAVGDQGFVAEGPTENIMILNSHDELVAPKFDYTLRGTTLMRAMELAQALIGRNNKLRDVRIDNVNVDDLKSAKEIMMVGTTLAVLPVTQFCRTPVGDGKVGHISREILNLILKNMGAEYSY